MLIVGELINTSRKQIREAVLNRDAALIGEIAAKQAQAGAGYIDVNCGSLNDTELEVMTWLVEAILQKVEMPLCIDSPDPRVLEAGLAACRFGQPMINSISGENERYRAVLPLAQKYRAKLVVLCMDDSGMPDTAAERLAVAEKIVGQLLQDGIPADDIYLDPLIKPVGTNDKAGIEALQGIRLIRERFPDVHLICGLSNISFGLPQRKVLNQAFMIQTMAMGMDAYILDPLDKAMMSFFYASRVLVGRDEYCMKYIKAYRKGILS